MRPLFGAALLAASLLCAAEAAAHAVLESTYPEDGSAIPAAPARVDLRFNEPVQPVAVQVIDRSGRVIADRQAASVLDNALRIALPESLATGAYLVSYRVISADAHPVSGAITFAVGIGSAAWDAGKPSTAESNPAAGAWNALVMANRAVHLAALMMAMGGAMYLLGVDRNTVATRRGLRGLMGVAIAIAATGALLSIGLQGGLLIVADPGELFGTAAPWMQGMASSRGPACVATLAGLALILAGMFSARRIASGTLLLAGCASILLGFVIVGHAATAAPRALAVCAWLIHAGAAAFWIGSLAPLSISLRQSPEAAAVMLRRFSNIAFAVVCTLVAAGVAMAALQMQEPAALTATDYGRVLLVKLCLVAVLLSLAALNRFWLLPSLARAAPFARARFAASLQVEMAVGLAVLAAAAALSQQVPPAGMPQAGATPAGDSVAVSAILNDSKGRGASLSLARSDSANHTMVLKLRDAAGEPLQAQEVHAEFSQARLNIEALLRRLDRTGDGEFRYVGPDFVVPGEWRVRVRALISDFEQTEFETTVVIRR